MENNNKKNNENVAIMRSRIKELIDQARILLHKESSEEIADYLVNNNVIHLPINIGDTVYFLSSRGMWGSLLTSGCPIERKADAIKYDGKIAIYSDRMTFDDPHGVFCEYWGEMAFKTEEEAKRTLREMQDKIGDTVKVAPHMMVCE